MSTSFQIDDPSMLEALRKIGGGFAVCDGCWFDGVASMDALLGLIEEAEQAFPDRRVMASLDALGQAAYTSGHAILTHDLEAEDGLDLDRLFPDGVPERDEYGDFRDARALLPVRLANLRRLAAPLEFQQLHGRLTRYICAAPQDEAWEEILPDGSTGETFIHEVDLDFEVDYGVPDFLLLNRNPDRALDRRTFLQYAPVAAAYDLVAVLPNGYFNGHLQPPEVYALARHFEQTHGYALYGIGACCVGFKRRGALSASAAAACAADIAALDGSEEALAQTGKIATLLQSRRYFLIHYTN